MTSPDPNDKTKLLQDIDYPHIVIEDVSDDEDILLGNINSTTSQTSTPTNSPYNSRNISGVASSMWTMPDPNQSISSPKQSPTNSPTVSRRGSVSNTATPSISVTFNTSINNNSASASPNNITNTPVKPDPKWKRALYLLNPFSKKYRKPMTAKDKLTLSWWKKWVDYGRFPWKFVLHTLVTAFVTTLVFLIHNDNTYMVATMSTFYSVFFPEDFTPEYGFDPATNTVYLYTIDDTIEALNNSVQSFYDFPDQSVDLFRFGLFNDSEPIDPKLVVTFYSSGGYNVFNPNHYEPNLDTDTKIYNITRYDLGPFEGTEEEIKSFFYSLVKMELHFVLYNSQLLDDRIQDHRWDIKISFDNSRHGGRLTLDLDATRELVSTVPLYLIISSPIIIINIITILLCAASTLVSLKAIAESFHLYQQTKKIIEFKKMKSKNKLGGAISWNKKPVVTQEQVITWSELPLSIKLKFFNFWFINSIIGNILVIIGCCFQVLSSLGPEQTIEYIVKVLLGIGCLLSYVNMVRYFDFDRKYTILIKALGNGMPNVVRFITGAFPIFIGYALCGMLLFSQDTQRFENLDEAAITLFSLQNGDDLQNTFRSTDGHSILSRIYFYTFVFIFIYAVANIFIAIIEDSYFSVKESRDSSFIGISNNPKMNILSREDQRRLQSIDQSSEITSDKQIWNKILKVHAPKDPSKKKQQQQQQGQQGQQGQQQQQQRGSLNDPISELTSEISRLMKEEQEIFQRSMEEKINNLIMSKLSSISTTTTTTNLMNP